MTTLEKVDNLRLLVNQYSAESFAGFFAYFIRRRPSDKDNIDLNKFDSKLKDFLYLIGLNVFSGKQGTEKFELDTRVISSLADKLNSIKRRLSCREMDRLFIGICDSRNGISKSF